MSDRALQDQVIRALADAPFRASAQWRKRGLVDPDRLERYARFVARHFYYERIVHFFKYSRALARITGRPPEAVLPGPAFDALLPTAVLGSRETAVRVAGLVAAHVRAGGPYPAIPYLDDLLAYEETMMVVEAGPRIWRDGADPGAAKSGERYPPARVEGTELLELAHDLPAILPQLLQPWTEVPQAPLRATRLLVARSRHGRVAVARPDQSTARVLDLADGTRTPEQLARAAGLDPRDLDAALQGLLELGAVRFSA
ncbi:MAG: hypothetical protein ACREMV_11780, partial [Gemmatimonadales bacterium]